MHLVTIQPKSLALFAQSVSPELWQAITRHTILDAGMKVWGTFQLNKATEDAIWELEGYSVPYCITIVN